MWHLTASKLHQSSHHKEGHRQGCTPPSYCPDLTHLCDLTYLSSQFPKTVVLLSPYSQRYMNCPPAHHARPACEQTCIGNCPKAVPAIAKTAKRYPTFIALERQDVRPKISRGRRHAEYLSTRSDVALWLRLILAPPSLVDWDSTPQQQQAYHL
jgi:hypothetical protein